MLLHPWLGAADLTVDTLPHELVGELHLPQQLVPRLLAVPHLAPVVLALQRLGVLLRLPLLLEGVHGHHAVPAEVSVRVRWSPEVRPLGYVKGLGECLLVGGHALHLVLGHAGEIGTDHRHNLVEVVEFVRVNFVDVLEAVLLRQRHVADLVLGSTGHYASR